MDFENYEKKKMNSNYDWICPDFYVSIFDVFVFIYFNVTLYREWN